MSRGVLAVGSAAVALALAPGATGDPPQDRMNPIVPETSLVAYARAGSVPVFASPQAAKPKPTRTLASPTDSGAVLSFLVRSVRPDWLRVYLPTRPNGSSGWIRRSDVRVYVDRFRVRIDLRARSLIVWKSGRVLERDSVGVGRAVTPTPS